MARHGDSNRKSREAFQQHNGRLKGTAKWAGKKIKGLLPGGG